MLFTVIKLSLSMPLMEPAELNKFAWFYDANPKYFVKASLKTRLNNLPLFDLLIDNNQHGGRVGG